MVARDEYDRRIARRRATNAAMATSVDRTDPTSWIGGDILTDQRGLFYEFVKLGCATYPNPERYCPNHGLKDSQPVTVVALRQDGSVRYSPFMTQCMPSHKLTLASADDVCRIAAKRLSEADLD